MEVVNDNEVCAPVEFFVEQVGVFAFRGLRGAWFDGADRSFGHCTGGNHAAAAVMMFKVRFRL